MLPTDVVILAGARTPMARYTGAFKHTSAIELGACAGREAIHRAGVDPAEIDHVVFGNVIETSSDALYGARLVLTLLLELGRRGLRYGLATACIGGGQGVAIVVEATG